jgi:peptide deformylase
MAILEIRQIGDAVLRKKAAPVKRISKNIRTLIKDMAETMYAADGAGLAAPQVGVPKRICVVDAGEGLIVLINPVITRHEGEVLAVEGCLSIPGKAGLVKRSEKITVEALDENGRRLWVDADGLLGRACQHEMDHLDGVLYVDIADKVIEDEPQEVDDNGDDGEE